MTPTQSLKEFQTVHYWHVPIKQDNIGHPVLALFKSDLAIFGVVNHQPLPR
jgi:hypothetical protein